MSWPGGNATGFIPFEFRTSGKWLELLKEIGPSIRRVAVLRDSVIGSGTVQFAVIQAVAPSLRMEVNPVNMRDAGEIERAVVAFARSANAGLVVTGSASADGDQFIGLSLRKGSGALATMQRRADGVSF